MRVIAAGVLAAVLAGCSTPPRDISIKGLNLADGTTLAALQNAVSQDDRAALGTYALLHWPKSKFYCGKPIGGSNAEVNTVGEAIALTRAYETALLLAKHEQAQTPAVARQVEERAVITQIDELVLKRDLLRTRVGPKANETAGAAEINRQLARLRLRLDQMRSAPPDQQPNSSELASKIALETGR